MRTHTPGPWVAKRSKWQEGQIVVQAGMPSNRVLARFGSEDEPLDDVDLANARLIAAAPDLLAALEELDAMYRRIAPDDPQGLSPDLHPAWKACKAALTRAKGEPA